MILKKRHNVTSLGCNDISYTIESANKPTVHLTSNGITKSVSHITTIELDRKLNHSYFRVFQDF